MGVGGVATNFHHSSNPAREGAALVLCSVVRRVPRLVQWQETQPIMVIGEGARNPTRALAA